MPSPTFDFSQLVNDIKIRARKQRLQRENLVMLSADMIGEFRDQIQVLAVAERTYLVALAIHSDSSKNVPAKLPCQGTPICACGYDCVNDYYGINCVDFVNLGYISVAFKMSVKGNSRWEPFIPIPECVLMRYLSESQKADLESFRAVYGDGEIRIEFLQMIE